MNDNKEEILNVINFLRYSSEFDKDFATKEIFKHLNENECLGIISKIKQLNSEIVLEKDKSKKGLLTREKGMELERLAKAILEISNIFKFHANMKCDSNEIDLLIELASNGKIFSEFLPKQLRDFVIVECKNYNKNIDVTWTGKLYSLLKYKNVKVGIMFSYLPLSGRGEWDGAKGLVKKLYLKDEILILNITVDEVEKILDHNNKDEKYHDIISLISNKMKEIQFHTNFEHLIQKHPIQLDESS